MADAALAHARRRDIEAPVAATSADHSIALPATFADAAEARAARDWNRFAVSASAQPSLAARPSAAVWVAAPDPVAAAPAPA